MDFGLSSSFWAVFFWINVAVCLILGIVVIRTVRKYEDKRKQFKKDLKEPGLGSIKWLLKHKLKEHGIDDNEQASKQIKTDSNSQ